MVHPHLIYMFSLLFVNLGFLKTPSYVSISHWKCNSPICFAWIIPYSFSIRYFLNLLSLNSCSQSSVIYVFHLLLNNCAIDIARLFLYCVNGTTLSVKFFSSPFTITQIFFKYIGSIKSTKSFFTVIFQLPQLVIYHILYWNFLHWQVSQVLTSFWTKFRMLCQYCTNVYESLFPLYPLLKKIDMYKYYLKRKFGVLTIYQIYSHTL